GVVPFLCPIADRDRRPVLRGTRVFGTGSAPEQVSCLNIIRFWLLRNDVPRRLPFLSAPGRFFGRGTARRPQASRIRKYLMKSALVWLFRPIRRRHGP